MPQIVKKRRSGWAILAVGALIASFLAVGAAPAAAIDEDSEQDHKASATACLGPALEDAGFTDLGSLEAAVDDINCLAYYEITTGRTADTFDPASNVTRSQMALFLSRTAGVMGEDLSGGEMGADFGDIAELGQDRQDAIAALARNGIMGGRGDMAFDPGGDITRAEMAMALVSLVDRVSSNLGKDDDGLFVFGEDEDPPNDSFGDAYRMLSEPVNNAISAAYELGITTGRPAGSDTFAPNDGVPRRNMATFIIRALEHSNVRPSGLSAQIQTRAQGAAEITVSVRDADFAPVANVAIDAFRTSAAQEDRAFKTDGSCSSRTSRVDGATKCEIDGADPVTTSLGNIALAQLSGTEIGEGLTVWIWQGEVGDEYGNDTDVLEMPVDPQPETAADARVAVISSDLGLEGNGDARYGQNVTFTIQLQDNEENDAATPEGGIEYNLRLELFNGRVPATTEDRTISVSPGVTTLGSDGSGTFVVAARDLDADNDSEVTVRYSLSRSVINEDDENDQPTDLLVPVGMTTTTPVPGTNPQTYTHTKSHIGIVVFSDGDAEPKAVSVDGSSHQSAPSNGNVGTAATVTVLDQYGRPMANQGIVLSSSATDDATTSSRPRFTGPSGQVRIGYSYGGAAAVETLTAIWDGDTADDSDDRDDAKDPGSGEGQEDDTECQNINALGVNVGGNDICGTTVIFWVGVVTDANSATVSASTTDQEIAGPADVLSLDADNQQLVIDGDSNADDDSGRAPVAMDFDSNDFFTVDNSPSSLDDFSEMLVKALAAFETASDDEDITAEMEPTLVWADYVFDDPSSSSWFQLVTNLEANTPS